MTTFTEYTDALVASCRDTAGVLGLLLVGSTSATAADRRDEWSDHDFYLFLSDDAAPALQQTLAFLPFRERIVLAAREGAWGFSVLYDDAQLMEFAAGTVAQIGEVRVNDHQLAYDSGIVAPILAAAIARASVAATSPTPATPHPVRDPAVDEIGLAMVKLMIGVGRARRGERLVGGAFVRTWAMGHLVRAVRARIAPERPSVADSLDPFRRFEVDYPRIGRLLGEALDGPVEDAGRAVFRMLRAELEPGWAEFPTPAADLIARRMGWRW